MAEIKQESPEVYEKLMSWTDSAVTEPVPEETCAPVLSILRGMRPPRYARTIDMVMDGAVYSVAVNLPEQQFSFVWLQGQEPDQAPDHAARHIIRMVTGH